MKILPDKVIFFSYFFILISCGHECYFLHTIHFHLAEVGWKILSTLSRLIGDRTFLQILGLLGCLLLLSTLILEIFIERIFHKVIKVTAIGGGSHHWGIEEQSKEFFRFIHSVVS